MRSSAIASLVQGQRPETYVLACDERGSRSWNSTTRTFAVGGIATSLDRRDEIANAWDNIKQQLCGTTDVELKWSHFFPGFHQRKGGNPLGERSPSRWRQLARWALEELFTKTDLFPITAVVQKDRASQDFFSRPTSKGSRIVNIDLVLAGLLGQYALYLEEQSAIGGEIWFDQQGSLKEEERIQVEFRQLFANSSKLPAKIRGVLERVDPKITFLNSRKEPLIETADFVSGAIWAASEQDDFFLLEFLEHYAPGKRRTYGILLITD
jgi:Protein of unknown function (DUF3800)